LRYAKFIVAVYEILRVARGNPDFVNRIKSVVTVSLLGASISWGILALRANNHHNNAQPQYRLRPQTGQKPPAENSGYWVADPLLGWVRVDGKERARPLSP
jgi:hypothetical protein